MAFFFPLLFEQKKKKKEREKKKRKARTGSVPKRTLMIKSRFSGFVIRHRLYYKSPVSRLRGGRCFFFFSVFFFLFSACFSGINRLCLLCFLLQTRGCRVKLWVTYVGGESGRYSAVRAGGYEPCALNPESVKAAVHVGLRGS